MKENITDFLSLNINTGLMFHKLLDLKRLFLKNSCRKKFQDTFNLLLNANVNLMMYIKSGKKGPNHLAANEVSTYTLTDML